MYIKYVDDPGRKRVSSAFGNLCDGDPKKKALRLFDQCFSIFDKEQQVAAWCELAKLNYPVDGFSQVETEICSQAAGTIFNNNLQTISAVSGNYPLDESKNFARGILLWIQYPKTNSLGGEIIPADMQCQVRLYDRPATSYFSLGTHEFFSHFSNPDGDDATDLLNRLDVYNPNANFSIKVKALIIYTKTNSDPNDVSC